MKIYEIYIKSFGCIHDKRIDLSKEGITVFSGNNESGKSTLAAFIKFIFYGLSQKEKWDGISEKDRYISWQSGMASGTLSLITSDSKKYRIEREIIQSKRTVEQLAIVDLESGAIVKNQKPFEMFLDGVSSDVFTKTCFVSQHAGVKSGGKEVKSAVENMMTGGDEDTDTQNALSVLDKARTKLLHKNEKGGMLFEIEEKINSILQNKKAAQDTAEQNSALETKLISQKSILSQKQEKLEKIEKDIEISQAVMRLQKVKETIEKKESLARQKKAFQDLVQKSTVNGFIPDNEYKNNLEQIHNQISYKEEQLDQLTDEFEEYQKSRTKLLRSAVHIMNANAKKDELQSLKHKLKNQKLFLAFFGAIVVLSAILAVLINKLIFISTIISLAGLIFNIICSSKTSNLIFLLYQSVNTKNHTEFNKLISEYAKFAAALEKLNTEEKLIGNQIDKIKEEIKDLEKNFENLTRQWNITFFDRKSFISAVSDFIEKYSYESKDIARKEEELANCKDDYMEKELEELSLKAKGITTPPIPLSMLFTKDKEKKLLIDEIEYLKEGIAHIEKTLVRNTASIPDTEQLDIQFEALNDKRQLLKKYLNAIKLAYSTLELAGANTRNKFAPYLSKTASILTSKSTEGKYKDISVDDQLNVTFFDGSRTRDISNLSEGTKAIVYLAFRMSLTSGLFKDPPPIVLDESLASLDDIRLENALRTIDAHCKEKGGQVFILTCNQREINMLKTMNDIDFENITL